MKKLLATLILFGSCIHLCFANITIFDQDYGTHGMLLFGNQDGLYAAHLSMFHPPHDYQVVLKIRLTDRLLDEELRRQLEKKPTLWTIEPEQFNLSRLSPDTKSRLLDFKANIVDGHFEKSGYPKYKDTQISIQETLIFRQLPLHTHSSNAIRYWQIGSGKQRFLLKEINARPDFDHVVSINVPSDSGTEKVELPRNGVHKPNHRQLEKMLKTIAGDQATINTTVYFNNTNLR